MALTREQIKAQLEELQNTKTELEKKKAVAQSELGTIEAKLKEVEPKVLKIVGSTDEGEVKKFLENLEKDIQSDLEKIKSMQGED
jgi:Icc-related predicted phosphoesterase